MKTILIFFSLLFTACGTIGVSGLPKYEGRFWAGNSSQAEIRRTQDPAPNTISAFDKKFDDYACLSYEDLSCLYFTFVQNAVTWFSLSPSCPRIDTERLKILMPQMEKEIKESLGTQSGEELHVPAEKPPCDYTKVGPGGC